MKPVIEINQLGKKYRIRKAEPYLSLRDTITASFKDMFRKSNEPKQDFWALQDIDLTIEQGERIGIIGRNGAGKSTLLKILSRVTWPTTGSAIIRGRLASLLEVGTGFHPELSGRENIYLNGSILGLKKTEIDKQFDAIVDFSGVEIFLDTPLKNYSSGMQLRLAFAVAAHLEPEVLLIDEVLAVGDMEFQKKCIGKMEEVSRQHGRTIIFVSHQLNSISNLCTRGILLENGRIKLAGHVPEVITHYINSAKNEPGNIHYKREHITSNYYFNDIEILTPYISSGEDVTICIGCNEKYKGQQLVLNINIIDDSDQLISHIINEDDSFSTEKIKNKILINLREINLRPGKYYLSFWAGFDREHGIDWLDKVVNFEIQELNTFTRRITPFPSNSKILIRSTWQAD